MDAETRPGIICLWCNGEAGYVLAKEIPGGYMAQWEPCCICDGIGIQYAESK